MPNFLLSTLFAATPLLAASPVQLGLPDACVQAVVVTSASWDSSSAVLQRWERTEADGEWQSFGEAWPVCLGKRGMAWGRGLHAIPRVGAAKTEGDGTSPAGIFHLGPAFGYEAAGPAGIRFPWRQATDRDCFVDDPESPDYNQWVRLAPGEIARWKSAERMRREDNLYALGVVVRHNMHPVRPGAGSAIFLHVWSGPDSTTAGCTAMERDHLLTLLTWLDPAKSPVLVQAPVDEWANLRFNQAQAFP